MRVIVVEVGRTARLVNLRRLLEEVLWWSTWWEVRERCVLSTRWWRRVDITWVVVSATRKLDVCADGSKWLS